MIIISSITFNSSITLIYIKINIKISYCQVTFKTYDIKKLLKIYMTLQTTAQSHSKKNTKNGFVITKGEKFLKKGSKSSVPNTDTPAPGCFKCEKTRCDSF